jgi:hypothetical protein
MDTYLRIQICKTNIEEELELLQLVAMVVVVVAMLEAGVDWKHLTCSYALWCTGDTCFSSAT